MTVKGKEGSGYRMFLPATDQIPAPDIGLFATYAMELA